VLKLLVSSGLCAVTVASKRGLELIKPANSSHSSVRTGVVPFQGNGLLDHGCLVADPGLCPDRGAQAMPGAGLDNDLQQIQR
jgi:hypothetical protein